MTYREISGRSAMACAFLVALLALTVPHASSHGDSANAVHGGHEGMDTSESMHDQTQSDLVKQATLARDKKESEFNHHLAGSLVVLAGLFLLGADKLRQRWPSTRFAWPACFLLCGLFLLIFSDTELWPFGTQTWWYGLTHNLEDLQHKTFAVILLTLGVIEVQRPWRSQIGLGLPGVPGACLLWFRDAPFSRAPQRHVRSRSLDCNGPHPGRTHEFRCRRLRYWRVKRLVGAAHSRAADFRAPLVASDDRARRPPASLHGVNVSPPRVCIHTALATVFCVPCSK